MATRSPSADKPLAPPSEGRGGWHDVASWTFQARLVLAIVSIVAITLFLVSVLVLNRLDAYFSQQQEEELRSRTAAVASYVFAWADSRVQFGPVVGQNGLTDVPLMTALSGERNQRFLADILGRADVEVRFGRLVGQEHFEPSPNGLLRATLQTEPSQAGLAREGIQVTEIRPSPTSGQPYAIQISLANPYTFRATTVATVTGLLIVIGLAALVVAMVVATVLARRFTSPLRRLTEASRSLAEGDLSSRVQMTDIRSAPDELMSLADQFNQMAARLEESIAIIRSDRDRSREFLADVSHELRTPIAALRTFNELLTKGAASDPEARTEFLESSRVQLERLDWLAQNLLELSKLDSGLVLLDLRPDDLRGTVEQAVDAAEAAARKRKIRLDFRMPEAPLRVLHDPQRVGQAVSNLVGNAIKFTPPGGSVVVTVAPYRDGARIEVVDTGIGIDASELPHIFERFYRGARSSEARSSGSGLGLAIVKSIVDMHGGSIAVESRLGAGSRFTVSLPRDPRLIEAPGVPPATTDLEPVATAPSPLTDRPVAPAPGATISAGKPEVTDSSPTGGSRMNPGPAR